MTQRRSKKSSKESKKSALERLESKEFVWQSYAKRHEELVSRIRDCKDEGRAEVLRAILIFNASRSMYRGNMAMSRIGRFVFNLKEDDLNIFYECIIDAARARNPIARLKCLRLTTELFRLVRATESKFLGGPDAVIVDQDKEEVKEADSWFDGIVADERPGKVDADAAPGAV